MSASRLNCQPQSSKAIAFLQSLSPNHCYGAEGPTRIALRGKWWLRHLAPAVCAVLLIVAWPIRGYSQSVVTTIASGTNPTPVALNPVTNRIYSASYQDGTV